MTEMHEWLGGSPEEIAESLVRFSRSSELLSVDSTLVDKYAQKWVGVCFGEVKAVEDELDALLNSLDRQGVPRSEVIVRFIEREQRALFL